MRVSEICARSAGILEPGPKAERTRAAILAAAEEQFARRGYVATRLEDVAAAVGLKRAALFYHFRDKQSLYDAVIAGAFSALTTRIDEAFSAPVSVAERVERAVEVWVDTMVARPTLARLVLRHAAEAEEHASHDIFAGAGRLLATGWSLFEQGRKSGELNPIHDDPFHAASAVLGSTVFYVAGFAALVPATHFQALAPEQVEEHKRNALQTLRQLLGIRVKRRKRAPAKPSRTRHVQRGKARVR